MRTAFSISSWYEWLGGDRLQLGKTKKEELRKEERAKEAQKKVQLKTSRCHDGVLTQVGIQGHQWKRLLETGLSRDEPLVARVGEDANLKLVITVILPFCGSSSFSVFKQGNLKKKIKSLF